MRRRAPPGLVGAAAVWAPVSSLAAENLDRWIREDPARDELTAFVERRYGLPGQPGSARFWREISARTYVGRITEPVLIVQGGSDDTECGRVSRGTPTRSTRSARGSSPPWTAPSGSSSGSWPKVCPERCRRSASSCPPPHLEEPR